MANRTYSADAIGRSCNRVATFVLLVAIAGAPLPFGSREATAVAFWCLLLGAGLIIASPRQMRRPHLILLAGIGLILICFGFVLHEQLADHPWLAQPDPVWAQASEALGRPLKPSVSIVRGEPFYALGPALAAVLALTLGLIVGTDRVNARKAVLTMAWSGVFYACYGILSLLLEPTMLLWREKTAYVGSLTATFINRNTAATYLGSCAAVWLVLLMQAVRGRLPRGPIVWSDAQRYLLNDLPTSIPIRFIGFFICLAALFLTNSRGGVIISLMMLAMTFVAYFRRDLPRGKGLLLGSIAAAAVTFMLMQFMGGNVSYRIDVQGLSDAGRLAAYRSTLHIIADHPWFGTGLGTFAYVFPAYRSGDISMWGVWDRAHNTLLELAAEVGVPLAAIIAIGWLIALIVLIRGTRGSRRTAAIPLAALSISMIGLLHSMIDFSLQLTGYAVVVFALLGIGLAQSFPDDTRERSGRGRRQRQSTGPDQVSKQVEATYRQ